MQAQSGSQRSQRDSPGAEQMSSSAATQPVPSNGRQGSGSSRTSAHRRNTNPATQLSQIEKSVTALLVATKSLLETLTRWSQKSASESEVSDVYVKLGYEFNIACRAFTAINVETADLGNVPDILRVILEDTLSQEPSVESLNKYLPEIRKTIIGLLQGLKKKQQKLRNRGKEGVMGNSRSGSGESLTSSGTGLTQMLENVGESTRRSADSSMAEDIGAPPRSSSMGGRSSPARQEQPYGGYAGRSQSNRDTNYSQARSSHTSSTSMSSNTMQNIPVVPPQENSTQFDGEIGRQSPSFPHPPPPPPKQDALATLQRSGDLERRASRRYSAYQIAKHIGASPNGVAMMSSTQNSPIPNRGRDVRESMNAVRVRGGILHSRQRSTNRLAVESSPSRENIASRRISEEKTPPPSSMLSSADDQLVDRSDAVQFDDKSRAVNKAFGESQMPVLDAAVHEPPRVVASGVLPTADEEQDEPSATTRQALSRGDSYTTVPSSPRQSQSPQPVNQLTLFLQYRSRIKKFVLPDGYNELSLARLQLAFIEKFNWNTHSNGNDLPEIYIQDPVSGVRHELEDLSDVKDRSVLVLNVEVLDEVKKHIDEGLGGIKKLVEGVRGVVEGQNLSIQRVVDKQQDAAKEIARLAASPSPPSVYSSRGGDASKDGRMPTSTDPVDRASQLTSIRSLRRDLAVMRQTYSSFVSNVEASMATVKAKAAAVKTTAITAAVPELQADTGRAYVNSGKKQLGEDSDRLVARVDDLQDIVEDLRKDVVTRGVRPIPRQLEAVGKDISTATVKLKKMQEYLKREKPIWTKIWEKELELVCTDRDLLTMQEELAADLEDDLEKATQTFALVEQCTQQQMKEAPRSTSRGLQNIASLDVDPHMAKEGVLGEVRALRPNHENRLEAIERAEKARQRELESRRGGEFQKELGDFVEEGKLKKSGGVEEAERLRKAKDDRIRREVWERMNGIKSKGPPNGEVPTSALVGEEAQQMESTEERPGISGLQTAI